MKLIGNICFAVFVIWVASFFFKSEAKELPSNEALISQFDQMELFEKGVWKKGNVVDGVQVYTTITADNILRSTWLLGVKQAGVISLSDLHDPAFESIAALSVCFKLVRGVLGRDSKEDFKVIEDAFKFALSSKPIDNTLSDIEILDGYKFEVQIGQAASNINLYACSIKQK
ncbi:hypothetical protein LNV77_23420 [Klebsiella pneumoniae]|nr:hypothetical protein [Klebsiella pneumoniae]MCJ4446657.1 hypothetical protein [Klebsiella pneumoniae]MCJ4463576.1 hypothetical protein [Klebsiella pneumoniae]